MYLIKSAICAILLLFVFSSCNEQKEEQSSLPSDPETSRVITGFAVVGEIFTLGKYIEEVPTRNFSGFKEEKLENGMTWQRYSHKVDPENLFFFQRLPEETRRRWWNEASASNYEYPNTELTISFQSEKLVDIELEFHLSPSTSLEDRTLFIKSLHQALMQQYGGELIVLDKFFLTPLQEEKEDWLAVSKEGKYGGMCWWVDKNNQNNSMWLLCDGVAYLGITVKQGDILSPRAKRYLEENNGAGN